MQREELISKGYTEEQVTELLNLFHEANKEVKDNNSKLSKALEEANGKITELSKVQKQYQEKEKSQLSELEKLELAKKEIEEHLANAKLIENKANAKTIFAEIGGVDDTILDSIVSADFTKTEANAKALVDLIKQRDEAIAKKTKEALLNQNILPKDKSNTGNDGKGNSLTKEEFNNLSIQEKTKIFKEDRELWDKMTQQ